ncbi:hypothetical protein [Streptomyces spiramenti]|uniref:Uncharacterized protein n=1 Tax=Streptomyces spiramenti TaxID=2720606 RepID=A0ABX1AQL8_9ACTN|nr:hypothetical protein [Streptomyces spiramenti]NJP66560.1 hypothetical protein [Streptomyces spiramenti]
MDQLVELLGQAIQSNGGTARLILLIGALVFAASVVGRTCMPRRGKGA